MGTSLVHTAGVGSRSGDESVATKDTGVSDYSSLVGDYKNPILQAWAADVVKKKATSRWPAWSFRTRPTPAGPNRSRSCSSTQQCRCCSYPDQIVMLFNENHEVRRVRMNQPHPAKLTPSWHACRRPYEGDTLVIDTVGVRADRPHP